MIIKIYRGSKEIGGTCVEIVSDSGRTMWIDLGAPLSAKNPNVQYARNPVDALLVSHPHQDHYGLIENMKPTTPVYMGQVTQDLINATRIFLKTPLLNNNISIFRPWKWITVADAFRVKPYLVDHSSPEALAFLVEVDGKRIFYTGDFRSTGRKHKLFDNLIRNPPKDIDLMLTEGTMVNRSNARFPSEEDVEAEITRIIANQKNASFIVSSGQNIDRFCGVFRACVKTHKTLVVDIYGAWILEVVGRVSAGLPKADASTIKVYMSPSQLKTIQGDEFKEFRNRIANNAVKNEVFVNPSDYVYFLRNPNRILIDKLKPKGTVNVVYSMWEGYLTEKHKKYNTDDINLLKKDRAVDFQTIHTSGHATMGDLKKLARAINPALIVPIHTEYPEDFRKEFAKAGFANVGLWDDNKGYAI